jgi:acyl-CoA reductase-like NAD-dependent aldehyde dehydrogenase
MTEHADDLARLIVVENGKSLADAKGEAAVREAKIPVVVASPQFIAENK